MLSLRNTKVPLTTTLIGFSHVGRVQPALSFASTIYRSNFLSSIQSPSLNFEHAGGAGCTRPTLLILLPFQKFANSVRRNLCVWRQ